ncbi:MAG: hypothetical protein Fur0012_00800 [Elusimicrobiota bacterium]
MQNKHLTILLTDIKGFTSKTSTSSRIETIELLKKHKEIVVPVIEKNHGRIVKNIGDAFLAVFESPTDAVLCGIEIQDVLKKYNEDRSNGEKIEIRIAINSGEVAVSQDGDVFGDAVNITSRLEGIAEAGQVFFTEAVYLSMNKNEVPSSEIGYRQFKGIPQKIKVYRVLKETPVGQLEKLISVEDEQSQNRVQIAPQPATFGRRFGAIILDFIIFSIILSVLGIQDSDRKVRAKSLGNAGKSIEVSGRAGEVHSGKAAITFNGSGIKLEGNNGEKITVGEQGISVVGGESIENGKLRKSYHYYGDEEGDGKFYWKETKKFPLKFLLWFLYCAVMVWRFSATLGKMIMKLKVVDDKGERPSADKAFLRSLVSLLSLGAIGLGYIWALGKEKKTWHDILSNTKVVRLG